MSTGFHPDAESPYDPELPFLEALEHEVHRHALRAGGRREESAPQRSSPAASRSQRPTGDRRREHSPLRGTSRIARRSFTLVALICLIGASAFGAGRIFSSGAPNPNVVRQGPLVTVAGGHAGADTWSLRLYRRETDLCRVLLVAETESSRCAPAPGTRSLAVTSVVSPLRRYVFGVSGGDVAQVSVRVGSSTQTVATHALDTTSVGAADPPGGMRWFVAVLDRPPGVPTPPAVVRAIDVEHRTLGSGRVSCVETGEAESCR
jgi:hypothetical protein